MKIKANDTVVVLSGKNKGHKGKVLVAMPAENKVIVEGVNVATCHTKPRKQGEQGGIIHKEIPVRADKVMLVCPKCGKATRVGKKLVHSDRKNKDVYVRCCKNPDCGEIIDPAK